MPSETRSDGILQPIKIVGSNKISPAVIPAKAGIWKFNVAVIYRKNRNPPRRHSRKSGNLETKNYRDLSETTNPLRRHSRAGGNLEI
ncbi:TPA: hypothetical protein WHR58_002010 [Neisseria meningitidis]